jgi:hypothetical protein
LQPAWAGLFFFSLLDRNFVNSSNAGIGSLHRFIQLLKFGGGFGIPFVQSLLGGFAGCLVLGLLFGLVQILVFLPGLGQSLVERLLRCLQSGFGLLQCCNLFRTEQGFHPTRAGAQQSFLQVQNKTLRRSFAGSSQARNLTLPIGFEQDVGREAGNRVLLCELLIAAHEFFRYRLLSRGVSI